MGMRGLGVVLALALVGAAGGYAVGDLTRDQPAAFAQAAPVPASDPSFPVDPLVVLPDPATPAPLATDLRLRPRTVGTAPFDLAVPIPRGWVQTKPTSGEWRWYPPPGLTPNTFFLRVRLIGNSYQTVSTALGDRIDALEHASDVEDFHLEEQTADSFTANYVSGHHRRVAMEAFVSTNGGQSAFAWIALIGRPVDRAGLAELFDRVMTRVRG